MLSYRRELFKSMSELLTFLNKNNVQKERIVQILPFQTRSCESFMQLDREYELIYLSDIKEKVESKFHVDDLVIFEDTLCKIEGVSRDEDGVYWYICKEVIENPIIPRMQSVYRVEEDKLTKYERGRK